MCQPDNMQATDGVLVREMLPDQECAEYTGNGSGHHHFDKRVYVLRKRRFLVSLIQHGRRSCSCRTPSRRPSHLVSHSARFQPLCGLSDRSGSIRMSSHRADACFRLIGDVPEKMGTTLDMQQSTPPCLQQERALIPIVVISTQAG